MKKINKSHCEKKRPWWLGAQQICTPKNEAGDYPEFTLEYHHIGKRPLAYRSGNKKKIERKDKKNVEKIHGFRMSVKELGKTEGEQNDIEVGVDRLFKNQKMIWLSKTAIKEKSTHTTYGCRK